MHLRIRELEDALRGQRLAGEVGKAFEDCECSFAIELLVDDGVGQAVELGGTEFHAAGAHPVDDGGQDGVGLLQVADGGAHEF